MEDDFEPKLNVGDIFVCRTDYCNINDSKMFIKDRKYKIISIESRYIYIGCEKNSDNVEHFGFHSNTMYYFFNSLKYIRSKKLKKITKCM